MGHADGLADYEEIKREAVKRDVQYLKNEATAIGILKDLLKKP